MKLYESADYVPYFLMAHSWPLFRLFLVPLKQTTQISLQINVKNVHPVPGERIRTHDLQIMSLLR